MIKKITKIGGYSYFVSLPKEWLEIKKYPKNVNVEIEGESIRITEVKK